MPFLAKILCKPFIMQVSGPQPAGFLQIDRILKRKKTEPQEMTRFQVGITSPITSLLRSSQDLLGSSPISPWCSSAIWKGEVPPSLWGTYDHQSWLLNPPIHHQQKPPSMNLRIPGMIVAYKKSLHNWLVFHPLFSPNPRPGFWSHTSHLSENVWIKNSSDPQVSRTWMDERR